MKKQSATLLGLFLTALACFSTGAKADEKVDFYATLSDVKPEVVVVREFDSRKVWTVVLPNGYPQGETDGHFRTKQDLKVGYTVHVLGHQTDQGNIIASDIEPPGFGAGNLLMLSTPTQNVPEPPNFNVRGAAEPWARVTVHVQSQAAEGSTPQGWSLEADADEAGYFDIPVETGRPGVTWPLQIIVSTVGPNNRLNHNRSNLLMVNVTKL